MTAYPTLTTTTYVAAYQAELRCHLRNTGRPKGNREAVNRLAERWITRTGTLRATKGFAQPTR